MKICVNYKMVVTRLFGARRGKSSLDTLFAHAIIIAASGPGFENLGGWSVSGAVVSTPDLTEITSHFSCHA
jgi:hypothetical protein